MAREKLEVSAEKCSGCRICELLCSMVHHAGAFNPRRGLLRVETDRKPGIATPISEIDVPSVCQQCTPAPCSESCPVEAFVWDECMEIWQIDEELCTGCGACFDACPYGMIRIHDDKAMKCDLCGGEPMCVRYCPAGALTFS